MINNIVLIGRITKDLEIKYTESQKAVCNFTLAVNRIGQEQADFINIAVWGQQAENLHKYQSKGSLIAVNGALRVDNYEVNGERKYNTYVLANNIEYLSSKNTGNTAPEERLPNINEINNDPFYEMGVNVQNMPIDDSDLPF